MRAFSSAEWFGDANGGDSSDAFGDVDQDEDENGGEEGNSDGSLTMAVIPDKDSSVTVSMPMSASATGSAGGAGQADLDLYFSVEVITPKISFQGVLSQQNQDGSTSYSALIGQALTVSTSIGDALPEGGSVSYSWKLPAECEPYKSYEIPNNGATATFTGFPTPLTHAASSESDSFDLFFGMPDSKADQIACTITISQPGYQDVTVPVTGTIKIDGPTISVPGTDQLPSQIPLAYGTTQVFSYTDTNNNPQLRLGFEGYGYSDPRTSYNQGGPAGQVGICWLNWVTTPSKYTLADYGHLANGRANYLQVTTVSNDYVIGPGDQPVEEYFDGAGLDSQFPYNFSPSMATVNGFGDVTPNTEEGWDDAGTQPQTNWFTTFTDTPTMNLLGNIPFYNPATPLQQDLLQVDMIETFKTYLIYEPPGNTGSVVPIAEMDWEVVQSVQANGFYWDFMDMFWPGGVAPIPKVVNGYPTAFPTWSKIISPANHP